VPGQLVSPQILEFMRKLDVKEVHGYRAELGLAVFTAAALERGPLEPGPLWEPPDDELERWRQEQADGRPSVH